MGAGMTRRCSNNFKIQVSTSTAGLNVFMAADFHFIR
jgi:hypothetical protein